MKDLINSEYIFQNAQTAKKDVLNYLSLIISLQYRIASFLEAVLFNKDFHFVRVKGLLLVLFRKNSQLEKCTSH